MMSMIKKRVYGFSLALIVLVEFVIAVVGIPVCVYVLGMDILPATAVTFAVGLPVIGVLCAVRWTEV